MPALRTDRRLPQRLLLLLVTMMRSRRRRRADRAADVAEGAIAGEGGKALVQEGPSAHVARLVLRPDNFGGVRILRDRVGQHRLREGIELFEANERDVRARLFACRAKVVAD